MAKFNLFDVLSKIQIVENPRLLIMLTNDLFDKNYDLNSQVIFRNNEMTDFKDLSKYYGDIFYQIADGIYHVEIQSSKDKNMSKRMGNYSLRLSEIKVKEEATEPFYDYYIPRQYIITQREKWELKHIVARMFIGDELVHTSKIPIINTSEFINEDILENTNFALLSVFKIFAMKDKASLENEITNQINLYADLLKKGIINNIEMGNTLNIIKKYKEMGGEKMEVKDFVIDEKKLEEILETNKYWKKALDEIIDEKDELLEEKNELIYQKDEIIEEKDQTIKSLMEKLERLEREK